MKICVAGWYFEANFIDMLREVNQQYEVTVVSHASQDSFSLNGYKVISIPNIGLEFGCYDYYLKNLWDGQSDVFFCHDDIHLSDITVFDRISYLSHDCAYVFRDMAEEKANGGKHGRAVYCSNKFLQFVRGQECNCAWRQERQDPHNKGHTLPKLPVHRGFWYDQNNKGHTCGKPPIGIRHYNSAIEHFHWTLGRVRDQRYGGKELWPNPKEKMDVVNRVFFPEWEAGRRNLWKHKEREQKKYGLTK